ncbi:hypothetical protein RAD16_39970 [Bradyrhizobium sp. 18BD]
MPTDGDQWTWSIGFYPGTEPSLHRGASTTTLEDARTAFNRAGQQFTTKLTEENCEGWRRDRDFHAWKHRMW